MRIQKGLQTGFDSIGLHLQTSPTNSDSWRTKDNPVEVGANQVLRGCH